jgi:hypothetical protein
MPAVSGTGACAGTMLSQMTWCTGRTCRQQLCQHQGAWMQMGASQVRRPQASERMEAAQLPGRGSS